MRCRAGRDEPRQDLGGTRGPRPVSVREGSRVARPALLVVMSLGPPKRTRVVQSVQGGLAQLRAAPLIAPTGSRHRRAGQMTTRGLSPDRPGKCPGRLDSTDRGAKSSGAGHLEHRARRRDEGRAKQAGHRQSFSWVCLDGIGPYLRPDSSADHLISIL